MATVSTSIAAGGPRGLYTALKREYGGSFDPSVVSWSSYPCEWISWAICNFPVHIARKMAKNIDVNTLSYGELTAMGWCAMAGDVRRLCMLAEKGGDIDGHLHNGWRPIHVAISSNREDCVHQLLERGCNPNAPGQNGLTACHLACVAGSFGGLGILIENGADPFIEADNGRTAIYYASESGNRKCVRMLISLKRFIPNHTDHFGMTPLHICRNIECASILLSSGVDPRQADIEGRRAWQTVPIQEVREYLMASVYAKRKPAPPWGKF